MTISLAVFPIFGFTKRGAVSVAEDRSLKFSKLKTQNEMVIFTYILSLFYVLILG